MKKKFLIMLIAAVMCVSLFGAISAFAAGSAVVTFSGPTTVVPGQTYTYTYTLKVTGAAAANANIAVGGAFEKVSGGTGLFYDTIPENTTGTVSGTVKVKVKSNAAYGSTATLSVLTDESECAELQFDSSGKYTGQVLTAVTGSFSAKVAPPPPAKPGVYSAGNDRLLVKWSAVKGASGYEVWRSASASGGYTRIATTTNTSYIDKGLTAGKSYYYRIRSYYIDAGKTLRGTLSSYGTAAPTTLTAYVKPSISADSAFNKTIGARLKITVGVKFDCKVATRITDAKGSTVVYLEKYLPYSAGSHNVYWDGMDSTGSVVSSGTYYIVVIERYQDGSIYYTKKKLTVSVNKTPAISSNSTYNKTGGNRHLIKFSIVGDTKVTVAIKDANKKTVRNIEYKKSFAEGQYNVYWDGKDNKGNVVSSGVYYIYVIRYDSNGTAYTRKKLTVNISKYPTIYSNSVYTRTGTKRHLIKVDIATPAKVSTCIKDANFRTVLYLENKVNHADGRFYVYWDGKKNGKSVPNGTYYIYAIKYNSNGSYIYTRKKLTLK